MMTVVGWAERSAAADSVERPSDFRLASFFRPPCSTVDALEGAAVAAELAEADSAGKASLAALWTFAALRTLAAL